MDHWILFLQMPWSFMKTCNLRHGGWDCSPSSASSWKDAGPFPAMSFVEYKSRSSNQWILAKAWKIRRFFSPSLKQLVTCGSHGAGYFCHESAIFRQVESYNPDTQSYRLDVQPYAPADRPGIIWVDPKLRGTICGPFWVRFLYRLYSVYSVVDVCMYIHGIYIYPPFKDLHKSFVPRFTSRLGCTWWQS